MNEEIDTALVLFIWLTVWRFPRFNARPPTTEGELITTYNHRITKYIFL